MGFYSCRWETHIVDTRANAIRSFRFLIVTSALLGILFIPLSRHNVEATIEVASQGIELDVDHNTVEGVWSDGTTMWVLADSEDKLVAYDLASRTHQSDKDITLHSWNGSPQGIWSDGSIMWVADWDDTKLYAYSLNHGTRLDDRDINLTGRNDGPRGVGGVGDTILVVDKDDTWVYAYDKTDGTRQESNEFNLHGDNRHPWGIWATGSTVWVSDIDDDMLYAYTTLTASFSNSVRHEAREIRLPLGNWQPRGIWSDGETMWVVDDGDDYVYAMYYRDFRHVGDEFEIDDVNEPTGLWTDGDTAWVADAGQSGAGKLFAYDVSSGSRVGTKDVRLENSNDNPVAVWSDGTTVWVAEDESGTQNEFLYAYALDQDPNEQQLLQSGLSIHLDSDNSNPAGAWSDGDTIWVSDSEDDKLYAYDLTGKQRQSAKDITLVNANADPGGIWGNGQTIWVLDVVDKHVYAYSRGQGARRPAKEFRPVPANDDLSGGLAGHGLRLWVVDTEDESVYAYAKLNTPPTFDVPSATFNIHYSLEGNEYVGTASATDPDGDSLTFDLSGPDAGLFRVGSHDGEIRTRAGTTNFTGGDELSFTVSVTDGKSGLDGVDSSRDDAINVTVHVDHNADPAFSPPGSTTFDVDEDIASGHVIAELDIIDLDIDDDLFVELIESGSAATLPFALELTDNGSQRDGEIKLGENESLDFESKTSYVIHLSVSDRKDDDGESDLSVDDEIQLTVNVNNVDETGSLILSHSEPQAGTTLSATLSDPDGVNLDSGQQITWKVQRSTDKSTWTDASSASSTDLVFSYTPVAFDAGKYLQFSAVYEDKHDDSDKTVTVVTENIVLSEPPSNLPPTFDEPLPITRSAAEDIAMGSEIGDPIAVSDRESDTLTFWSLGVWTDILEVASTTGQITLKQGATLDYETDTVHYIRIRVRDNKDARGDADTAWDLSSLVTVTVTNVDEPGAVELTTDSPKVDAEVTASLTDPDGSVANLTWQWQKADSEDAQNWDDIANATSTTYTPVPFDEGKFLRTQASYDDGEGTAKQASYTAPDAVVRSDNEPPEFDEGATTTRAVAEGAIPGARVGAAVTATDTEGDSLTYSLASGGNSDLFVVEPDSGRIEVADGAVLDYESTSSLAVVLQVSDSKDANYNPDDSIDDTIAVTINLVNVDEPGKATISPPEAEVGTSLTASLTDPDGGIAATAWQWDKSQDASNWTPISGATSVTYSPVNGDVGMYLRAVATYTDGEGSGKTATGTIASIVQARPVLDTSLESLTLNGIPFTFASTTLEYTLEVPNKKKRTKVTASPAASSGVSVEISPPDSRPRNGHQVELAVGETTITITVSEDQGSASSTYTARVTRASSQSVTPPQTNPQQVEEPTLAQQCRDDHAAGRLASCSATSFAVVRVEHDGSYNIDWSKWDSDNPHVTGYTITKQKFIYKMYKDDNGSVSGETLANVYEDCQFVDNRWTCEGPARTNLFEDWEGNPTQPVELATNADITEWSSSLDAAGRHVADETYYLWSGDPTDPNNTPTSVTYSTVSFDMHLYYFDMHEASQPAGRQILMVNGADGFDEV